LLRAPDPSGGDALLRFDALFAQPRPAGLLQEHAVHARAFCAARLASQYTVSVVHRCGIARGGEFGGFRPIVAVRNPVLSRPSYFSFAWFFTTSHLIAPPGKSGSTR